MAGSCARTRSVFVGYLKSVRVSATEMRRDELGDLTVMGDLDRLRCLGTQRDINVRVAMALCSQQRVGTRDAVFQNSFATLVKG
jgi:hypothetical protein